MARESSEASQEGVPFLLQNDDFLNFSETTDNLHKTLDAIREIIQCKTKIFLQKKEKQQQILDSQMMKLDNEKKEYIKKSEKVMNEMGEAKSQLMQIEHSCFSVRKKLSVEKQTFKVLEERIKQLQLESKQKNLKFYETSELFTTVIGWYKDYLNIGINFDKENPSLVTVTFKETRKDFKGYPYVKFEVQGDTFQILKTHPSSDKENEIMKVIVKPQDMVLFLHKFRKRFLTSL